MEQKLEQIMKNFKNIRLKSLKFSSRHIFGLLCASWFLRYLLSHIWCYFLQLIFASSRCKIPLYAPKNLMVDLPLPFRPKLCSNSVNMVVFTPSTPNNFKLRNAIRQTWAKDFIQDDKTTFVFLLGISGLSRIDSTVIQESIHHGDILLIDFIDSYFNISLKIFNGLKWIHDECRNAQFVFRADSDTVVFPKNLFTFLDSGITKGSPKILGYCRTHDCVMRIPFSKGCMSTLTFPQSFYPNYCFGFSYLLTMDVLSIAFANVINLESYFQLDDILLTGILAKDVPKLSHKGLFNYELRVNDLNCGHKKITVGGVSDSELLIELWKGFHLKCK